jgi:hypothetical protein
MRAIGMSMLRIGMALLAVLAAALPAPAATTAELLRCQKGIHTRTASFVKLVQTGLSNCAYKVELCKLAQEIDGDDPTACLASATAACASASAKVQSYKSAYLGKALLVCNVTIPDLEAYVGGLGFFGENASCGATNVNDLLECIFAAAQCSAERTLLALDPRAPDSLAMAGVAGAHPCVGP